MTYKASSSTDILKFKIIQRVFKAETGSQRRRKIEPAESGIFSEPHHHQANCRRSQIWRGRLPGLHSGECRTRWTGLEMVCLPQVLGNFAWLVSSFLQGAHSRAERRHCCPCGISVPGPSAQSCQRTEPIQAANIKLMLLWVPPPWPQPTPCC